ncbi:hypothetical protein GQ53DRAFT_748862 [Thozetella sp. PMI_491]|nr:hypothetical protein GQ53DRAFT_748862 [Thozetella sp. PMI_491]
MARTSTLARLLGPSLIVMVLAEAYNGKIFRDSTPHIVFLNGNILFVAGLAIVQTHNIWAPGPPIVVTLVGWSGLFVGLSRMMYPEQALKVDLEETFQTYAVVGVLCLVGSYLSLAGYRAK